MALRDEFRIQGDFLFRYRSYFPMIMLLPLVWFYAESLRLQTDVQAFWEANRPLECLALGVSLLGLGIRVLAVGYSADHTSGRNTSAGQIADSINQTGLYACLRHPLYLGNYFMWLGPVLFTFNPWFALGFTAVYFLYYERIMYAEESFLLDKFGEQYADYSKKVPAILPNLRGWVGPKYSFSWIKVIRQEKAGILNLFIVIFLLKTVAYYLIRGSLGLDWWWTWALVGGLVYYLVLKLLQKTTTLLAFDR